MKGSGLLPVFLLQSMNHAAKPQHFSQMLPTPAAAEWYPAVPSSPCRSKKNFSFCSATVSPSGSPPQNKNRKGIGNVFMEIVGSVPADIMSGVHLIIADSRIAQILPKRLIKCIAERSSTKLAGSWVLSPFVRSTCVSSSSKNMAIFVENRIGQLAPIPAGAVFIVYIIVINADAEAGSYP